MIQPGDILWDRFRVVSVEMERAGCAWLAPLQADAYESGSDATHLLLSLDKAKRSALGDVLAAVWHGANVPVAKPSKVSVQNGESHLRLPLVGDIEWLGTPDRGGVVWLKLVPTISLESPHADSDQPVLAEMLYEIASLAESLEQLLAIASADPSGDAAFCRAASALLNPRATVLSAEGLRWEFASQTEAPASPLEPPDWTYYAAPEAVAGGVCGEPALVFGVARLALALLFGMTTQEKATKHSWARLAAPDAAFKEFKNDSRAASLPKDVQALLARCLRPLPASRFPTLAKFRAALKKVIRIESDVDAKRRLIFDTPYSETARIEIPEGMTVIEAGPYLSGEKKSPRTLREFAMDVTPVTEREYRAFLKAVNREPFPGGPGSRGPKYDKHPVVNITWREAEEFAEHFGKRLPTAYEWEKAARGKEGRKFPYGNDYVPGTGRLRANGINTAPGKDAIKDTAPTGSFPKGASAYGVLDMAGNVLEWTSTARRQGERMFRALKGACFLDGSVELSRCVAIQFKSPDARENFVGFRCVKDV